MRAIDLALKDLLQLVRERATFLFLVAMPVVFTFMFGFAFGGFGGDDEDPRLPVGVLDQDGGFLAASLFELLAASDVVRVETLDPQPIDEIEQQVDGGDLAAAVIVPAGYSDGLDSGALAPLGVIIDPSSTGGMAVQQDIAAIALRLAGSVQAAQLSAQALDDLPAANGGASGNPERLALLQGAVDRAIAGWKASPISVERSASGAFAEDPSPSVARGGFAHTSPAMMVQFAIAGLIGAGAMLMSERKSGAMRRLLTTAISRGEILVGHYLAMVLMILFQLIILAAFGQFVLRVDYLREPLAILLVVLGTALWTASLGLLISAMAKNDDQVTIFALIPMFVLAGLGGAWMPLEFTGQTFQTIAHILPTAWSMDGFENIVIRGLGLESVLLGVGIMVAYAVVLFALAVWRFRFD